MKTFKDLVHKPHSMWCWTQARMYFDNWYWVSVVKTPYTYGWNKWLYELAIITKDWICYDTPITDDVIWYLSKDEVSDYMKQVQELPDLLPTNSQDETTDR